MLNLSNVCARGSGIKSVSGDDLLLDLLGLKPTTRSTASLCESFSTSESDEVTCYSTSTTIARPPSRKTAIGVAQSNPVNAIVLPVQPFHSPFAPFQSQVRFFLGG